MPLQTLAIDYTGRNMQDAVKAKGLPWSAAKVGSSSALSPACMLLTSCKS